MAKTVTIYTPMQASPEFEQAVSAHIAQEIANGNTSGAEIKTFDQTNDTRIIERQWVSVPAAESWIAFVETLTPPPISATIE